MASKRLDRPTSDRRRLRPDPTQIIKVVTPGGLILLVKRVRTGHTWVTSSCAQHQIIVKNCLIQYLLNGYSTGG